MSIRIGDVELLYDSLYDEDGFGYITTSIGPQDTIIDEFIKILAFEIKQFYIAGRIKISPNNCAVNSMFLCHYLKGNLEKYSTNHIDIGRLIIVNWVEGNEIEKIKDVYGETRNSIGRAFHELLYLSINIEGQTYHIAVETTIFSPYHLQFYIGTNDFEELIKTRYQCENFFITYLCDEPYYAIVYSGGKRKCKRKTKSHSTKHSSKSIKRRPKSYPSRQAKRAIFQK